MTEADGPVIEAIFTFDHLLKKSINVTPLH